MEDDQALDSPFYWQMRDPAGHLSFHPSTVIRHLASPIGEGDFLSSALAASLVDGGRLIPFETTASRTVVSPRVPFVSYPSEWCDAQLHDAALLTLQIEQQAVDAGYDLKDASAWNVLYQGTRPAFCDHSSFEALHAREWWAMGQFARHFVAPLAVSRRRGLKAHRALRAWRDGMPTDVSRGLLGMARFASRYWPLLAGSGASATGADAPSPATSGRDVFAPQAIQSFRTSLLTSIGWMMRGLQPWSGASVSTSPWDDYTDRRPHYSETSRLRKMECVDDWLERIEPRWVADFGCNTGEFAELALRRGASVVAIDSDHDSVQRLFRRLPDHPDLYPVVADLDDLSGSRGWAGEEYSGLADRLTQRRFDVVMVLALVHHLTVAAAIPIRAVAQFCARCTRGWLIVELVDEIDSQLVLLCTQRRRDPRDFSAQRQRDAFAEAGFDIEDEASLSPTPRSLLLLKRRA